MIKNEIESSKKMLAYLICEIILKNNGESYYFN
jgi:hypothetical protein